MAKWYGLEDEINQLWCDIINGFSRYELLRRLEVDYYNWGSDKWCRAKRFEVLKKAYDQCKLELIENREELKMTMFNRYLSVYQSSIENMDRANAIKALDSISKLSGINDPEKIDINQDLTITIDFGLNKKEDDKEEE